MKTLAFRMLLRPGQQDAYRKRHDMIWPELVEVLREAGISDYWIFFEENTDSLFAILKHSPAYDMNELSKQPVMIRWWAYMADLMLTNPDQSPIQFPLVPMFHMA